MSARGETIQLATRGSDLALRQAQMIKDRLETRRHGVELEIVETTGDEIQDELIHRLGTTGAFVRSLDQKVLAGELDGSVHSMKDMPTDQPAELVIAGVPERAPAADLLVSPDGLSLEELPNGATVGTASLRRQAQLLAARPDLEVVGLRGNVDTRLAKLLAPSLQDEHERRLEAEEEDTDEFDEDIETWFDQLNEVARTALEREIDVEYDAICLAEAGLQRSGLIDKVQTHRLDPTEFVPAPAQGAIAVTALDGDVATQIQDRLDHPPTRVETTVERTILGELGGGCVAPVGIYARLQGAVVTTIVRVLSQDGSEEIRQVRELPVERHADAAAEFAADLEAVGAKELIDAARRDQPDEAKRGA